MNIHSLQPVFTLSESLEQAVTQPSQRADLTEIFQNCEKSIAPVLFHIDHQVSPDESAKLSTIEKNVGILFKNHQTKTQSPLSKIRQFFSSSYRDYLQEVEMHHSRLSALIQQLDSDTKLGKADLTIEVGKEKFAVHKQIVSEPLLRKIEQHKETLTSDAFKVILGFLYTGTLYIPKQPPELAVNVAKTLAVLGIPHSPSLPPLAQMSYFEKLLQDPTLDFLKKAEARCQLVQLYFEQGRHSITNMLPVFDPVSKKWHPPLKSTKIAEDNAKWIKKALDMRRQITPRDANDLELAYLSNGNKNQKELLQKAESIGIVAETLALILDTTLNSNRKNSTIKQLKKELDKTTLLDVASDKDAFFLKGWLQATNWPNQPPNEIDDKKLPPLLDAANKGSAAAQYQLANYQLGIPAGAYDLGTAQMDVLMKNLQDPAYVTAHAGDIQAATFLYSQAAEQGHAGACLMTSWLLLNTPTKRDQAKDYYLRALASDSHITQLRFFSHMFARHSNEQRPFLDAGFQTEMPQPSHEWLPQQWEETPGAYEFRTTVPK